MAAPVGKILQKGAITARWCVAASSLRQYGNTPLQHHLSPVYNQRSSCAVVETLAERLANHCFVGNPSIRQYSSLTGSHVRTTEICTVPRLSLLQPILNLPVQPKRTIVKYSLKKGKKKSVSAVLDRFYRFNSGLWLRCRAGRNKRIWKKSKQRRKRIKQFVFCNKTQSKKLDVMVTKYWRRQKHIPDDPFAPFENRNWYGFKDHPGGHFVGKSYKKDTPINMPYKKFY